MKSPDEIKTGLEICSCDDGRNKCVRCPYFDGTCRNDLNAIEKDELALIQQLEAQVPRWISVEERLPEAETVVIVCGCGIVTTGIYYKVMQGEMAMWMTRDEVDITHWMPLPLPLSSPDGESTSLEDGGSETN